MPGKSPMKLEVTYRHDHSCLLGRKASKQTKQPRIRKFMYESDSHAQNINAVLACIGICERRFSVQNHSKSKFRASLKNEKLDC